MAPMRAKPFHRDGWVYEENYDGWRMIASSAAMASNTIRHSNLR